MKKYVGLINGRHEMPCKEFIFESVKNVHDYHAIYNHVMEWLETNINNDDELYVYVTGLTTVTAELISCCFNLNISLVLLNYDRESGKYLEQSIVQRKSDK